MKRKYKYFIILNSHDFPHNIVEYKEKADCEFPLCCDLNIAINFDSPEKLQKWVKENTSLSIENNNYHIEGHYLYE